MSASETSIDRRAGFGVFIVLYARRQGCVVVDLGKGDLLGWTALTCAVERSEGPVVVSLGRQRLSLLLSTGASGGAGLVSRQRPR